MSEATSNRPNASEGTAHQPWQFGAPNRDPHEIGRKGGIHSGISRRLRPQRAIEERILLSRNGMAQLRVLELRRQREAELDEERRRLDYLVCKLMDERDEEEATLASLRAEVRQLDEQLEERRAQAERALSDDDALIAYLRSVGEQRVELACVALGWVERESESVSDVVA